MADVVKMSVEPRPGVGKGAARAARRAGYVPGVIYGGKEDPVTIQLKGNELLKTLQKGGYPEGHSEEQSQRPSYSCRFHAPR